MKQLRYWCFLPAVCLLALPLWAQDSFTLGTDTVKVGETASVDLTMDSTSDVQGIQLAFDWDSSVATGSALTTSAEVDAADLVVTRVESDFVVLGVIVDQDGTGDSALPAGSTPLGTVEFEAAALGTASLTFRDGLYATSSGGPALDNIVVIGGNSMTPDFNGGSVEVVDCLPGLSIAPGAGNNESTVGEACVVLENCVAVQGFQVALGHDSAVLTLDDVTIGDGAAAVPTEFFAKEIGADGGTAAAIFDAESPFDGQEMAPGVNEIACYSYSVVNPPADVSGTFTTDLSFVDGVLGSPVKSNVYVAEGASIGADEGLVAQNGTFEVGPASPPTPVPEDCGNGVDDDGDGDVDDQDSDCQQKFGCGQQLADGSLADVESGVGQTVSVDFFVRSPDEDIQGLSMSIGFDCRMEAISDLDISGTVLATIGAEFISTDRDNDSTDGDGCEIIIGVLVDAVPPFDGTTIPALDAFQSIGSIDFQLDADADLCGETLEINFEDGLNGTAQVPVKNLISVENAALSPALNNCGVVVVAGEESAVFFRGDCNFSQEAMGMAVNIADAASVISFLFPVAAYEPACLDSCDCNDDGRIDLADTFCILNYLFQNGDFPPAPGTGLNEDGTTSAGGNDPTSDLLDCAGGNSGC